VSPERDNDRHRFVLADSNEIVVSDLVGPVVGDLYSEGRRAARRVSQLASRGFSSDRNAEKNRCQAANENREFHVHDTTHCGTIAPP
jgi:hypothetical protein